MIDDIPYDEIGLQPYESRFGHYNSMADLSTSNPLVADDARFGPDGFRLWNCTSNQWLQSTSIIPANSVAHQPMHDNFAFSFPETPDTSYEKVTFSEDRLSDMTTPTDTPTPLTDPRSRESSSYFKDPQLVDFIIPAVRTTNQATSAGAVIPPAAAVDVPIVSSVDHRSTKDTLHFDATTTATNGLGAIRRPVNTVRLRTARCRMSRRSSMSDIDAGTAHKESTDNVLAVGTRARLKHKRVEKQYRNRLSAQFERLLAVLPSEEFNSGRGGDYGNDEESDEESAHNLTTASVTKAEVLEVAAKLIGSCSCIKRRESNGGDSTED
ncbi:hypothetical protein GE09DRAFT_1133194 [Coniochaeta sp. 2T2.1]|nr:hypothetical protein GE09DRAFT_1133194 [Coniochaeta sp. 2T2.1]